MNDLTMAKIRAAFDDPEIDKIREAQPDQVEFCPDCAAAAQVYLPGRWSIGPTYCCPSCTLRFTLIYDTADDSMVLRSKIIRVA